MLLRAVIFFGGGGGGGHTISASRISEHAIAYAEDIACWREDMDFISSKQREMFILLYRQKMTEVNRNYKPPATFCGPSFNGAK